MRVAIHQPQYWPWPLYLHKVMSCDAFVYLDTVQFSKNGFQNRNQVKTAQGSTWFTLPVHHHLGQTLLETRISDRKALSRHWKTLETNYARTDGFVRWKGELQALLQGEDDRLCEIAIATSEWLLEKVGIRTPRFRASTLPGIGGKGSALIASICAALGATAYLSGAGAVQYMNPDDFASIPCLVWIQEREGCAYKQAFPEVGFLPDLSALDLVLNCPDSAVQVIQHVGRWRLLWSVA